MSFILDALKKSEAERQLGEVPSLQTSGEIAATQKRKASWLWPLVITLLVAAVLGWIWRQSENNAVGPVTDPQSQLAGQADDLSTKERADSDKLPRISQSPIASYTPPADAITVTDGMDMPDTGKIISITDGTQTATQEQQNEAQSTDKTNKSPSKVTEQQRVERLQKQRASERAEDEALVAAVAQRLEAERLEAERLAQEKNKATVAKTSLSNTVRLGELPSSVRSKIPDINITMQVYSSEPSSRFAIINGQRYMESDQIADAVTLDEILRQGIILKFRKYRILVH